MPRKFYIAFTLIIITILFFIMLNNINTVLAAAAEIIEEKATFTIISASQNKVVLKVQNYTSQEATLFWGNGDQLSLEQGEGVISYTYAETGSYTIKLTDQRYIMGQGVQISYLNETEFGKPIRLHSIEFNKIKIIVECSKETLLDWGDGSSCIVSKGTSIVSHDYAYQLGGVSEYTIKLGEGSSLSSAVISISELDNYSSFTPIIKDGICVIEKWIYPTTPEVETIIVLDVKWLPDQLVLLNIDTDIKYNPSNSSSTRISVQSTFWVAYTIKSEIVNNQVWWQIQLMDKTTGWVRQDLANPPSLIVITS